MILKTRCELPFMGRHVGSVLAEVKGTIVAESANDFNVIKAVQ